MYCLKSDMVSFLLPYLAVLVKLHLYGSFILFQAFEMLNNIYGPLNLILFDLSESTISSDYLLKIIVQIL